IEDATIEGDVDDDLLATVAQTSMTGKGTGDIDAEHLSRLVVEAVRHVESDGGVDRDAINVHTLVGAAASATSLIEGVVLDEEPMRDDMPRQFEDTTVALLDVDIEPKETDTDVEYNITSSDQFDAAIAAEDEELQEYVQILSDLGVEVVFTTGDVDNRAATMFAKRDISVFEDIGSDDADTISAATGASLTKVIEDIDEARLGVAESLRTERFGEEEQTIVEGQDSKTITLFARGGTEHVADELERTLIDAVDVTVATLSDGDAVPGAGAIEIQIADRVRSRATEITGRQQLAAEAFADAIDVLPRTIATNAGMDPVDALVELRSANERGVAGVISQGDDARIGDPIEQGVIDPAEVKREAVRNATEAARMIIRIDDVIASD
ncbi:MAG: TCP-1/cpn60 chaperonin family protein, partial [Halobacteriaceae archaeon]